MANAPSAKPSPIALGRAACRSSQTSLHGSLPSHDSERPVPMSSARQVAHTAEAKAPPTPSGGPVASRKLTVALTTTYEPSVIPANATTRQKGRILPDASRMKAREIRRLDERSAIR